MWGCRQWAFQVLLQGYVHSPTYCHNLAVHDLADWNKPVNIKLYHYTEQLLATYSASQAVEPLTQTVLVDMTLPVQGWVKDLIHLPKAGVARTQTVVQWATYPS